MRLYEALKRATTEEDVKDVYIKALGLKAYKKGLVDIQTEEIWFEAKERSVQPADMFAQLLDYVRVARKAGEPIPPFLAVINKDVAAILPTERSFPLFENKDILWPKSASKVSKETIRKIKPYIETHFVVYSIESDEKEFLKAIQSAIQQGAIIRTQITPDNLRQVFDKWVEMIGQEIEGVAETDYALLFFADIMFDDDLRKATIGNLPARLVHEGDKPIFLLHNNHYELSSALGYRRFWQLYHRPPDYDYREYLLERRDSLLPLDERAFKGAFYTPLPIVDKAYDLLADVLGKHWQRDTLVWDMCCGVGNLEVKHSNYRNVFMSTLDKADVDIMHANRVCLGAKIFQYDYLNDDIDDFGRIDYGLTGKLPPELQAAIKDAKAGKNNGKRLLILMNPPYAEAMHPDNTSGGAKSEAKIGVASTRISIDMDAYGYASREIFVQFLIRISREIPGCLIAMFSTLKYINAPNFESFREHWKARYLGGFVVHSKAFDGLKGDFPIGFLVWDTAAPDEIGTVVTKALDKNGAFVGLKSFTQQPSRLLLSNWITRPRSNEVDALPLKNAITPTTSTKDVRGTKWADDAIGSMISFGSDLQHSGQTALLSSGYCSAGGFFVTRGNLGRAAIIFAVRRLIKSTWLNDRDQFLQPSQPLSDEFQTDCLIWMLFNGSNLSASANNLPWNGRTWSLVNHFIPFSEREVKASGTFESDFMVHYLADSLLSEEAAAVLDEGREIWRAYFTTDFEKKIRDEFKLNRPDVGWYQIRRSLEANKSKGFGSEADLAPFKSAYDALSQKLRPMVYSLGFLAE